MPVRKKSLENLDKGKRFSSTEQPQNRGRKPSVLKHIKASGMSITDIKKLLDSLVWECSAPELATLLKDKDNHIPMGVTLILGALTSDMKNKSLINWEKIMDRVHGKPTQKDVIEFRDIPDTAKDRLSKIFDSEKEMPIKTKPKKPTPGKTGKNGK